MFPGGLRLGVHRGGKIQQVHQWWVQFNACIIYEWFMCKLSICTGLASLGPRANQPQHFMDRFQYHWGWFGSGAETIVPA